MNITPQAVAEPDLVRDARTVAIGTHSLPTLRDESLMGKQTRLFRQYVKLLFGA